MKILVLGTGMMGYGLLKDMNVQPGVEEIVAADINLKQVNCLTRKICSEKIEARKVDVTNHNGILKLMQEGFDVVASALPLPLCTAAATAAIEAGIGYADVAASLDNVFELDSAAKAANVTIVPHIGLDIGIDRVLCGLGARKLDKPERFHVWCGGFPQKGTSGYNNPLRYKISWHWPSAALSNLGTSRVLKNGKIIEIPLLSDPEEILFPEPIGKCETYTTGSLIDVVEHLGIVDVKDAWCKTVRWEGHCEIWRKLIDLHLLDEEPLTVKGASIAPRDFFLALGERVLQYEAGEGDIVCQRVEISGIKNQKPASYVYEFIDVYDSENEISAMARTTAFPCSIVAQLIAKNEFEEKGVVHPAKIGWKEELSEKFFRELSKRKIDVTERFLES
ncbi:MAG: saccharopine dehydrogenase family protein [Candidatus Hodarchaeota archaeon]